MEINKTVVIAFLIIVLLLWIFYPHFEMFDPEGIELLDTEYPRYGLRGDLVKRSCILNNYISPKRNIRLSFSGGEMYESSYTPIEEGFKDCRKVPCPNNGGYDTLDTCWTCGSNAPQKMKIPAIHPHVHN